MYEFINKNGNISANSAKLVVIDKYGKLKEVGTGGGSPTGPAGGDLSGTYPNPTVNWSNGLSVYNSTYYPLTGNPSNFLTQESVLQFPDLASFPPIGAPNTIYIALDTEIAYFWNGTSYAVVTSNVSGITGFGTVNTLPKFTPTGSQLGNSRFTDNGAAGRYGTASNYVEFLTGANIFLRLFRGQATFDITLGNPQINQELILNSSNTFGASFISRGYTAFRVGALGTTEALRLLATGQLQLPQTPATGTTSDFLLMRDTSGNVRQIAYPTAITIDPTPTDGSSNAVSSNGVFDGFSIRKRQIVNDAITSTVTGTIAQTIVKSYQLLPQTLTPSGFLELYLLSIRTGGASLAHNMSIFINTTNSLSGATLIGGTITPGNFSPVFPMKLNFILKDNLIIGGVVGQTTMTNLQSSATFISASCNNTVNSVWILVTITPGATNQVITVQGVEIIN